MQETEGDPKPEQRERLLASHWSQTLIGGGWGCNTPDRKDDLGPQRSRKLEVSIPLSKARDGAGQHYLCTGNTQTHPRGSGGKQGRENNISMRNGDPKPDPESKFIP